MSHDVPLLHLYSPPCWHDDAWLVGTKAGLACLRDALDLVLLDDVPGDVTTDGLFGVDGEGYRVRVVLTTEAGMAGYVLPYTDAMAQDPQAEGATWPKKAEG